MLIPIVLALAASTVTLDASGIPLRVQNPDISAWHETDRKTDPERGRGMLMLTRDPVKDAKGNPIQPTLTVIYVRRPAMVKTIAEFAESQHQRTPFPLLRKESMADEVIYHCHYNNGMEHLLTIAYRMNGKIGVQFIADTTEGVLPQVQTDIQSFIAGASKAFAKVPK